MKICVSAQGSGLDAAVDPRFGRCGYFLVVDTDSMGCEAVQNPYAEAMGGAGIQAAQLVAGKGVTAVLTGNVGPNAFQTLQAAGVTVVTGASGTVKEAVETYKKGGFTSTDGPSVGSKFGTQPPRT